MEHRIGVMDSGMGGLTVVRSLIAKHVPASLIYVGDNANMPYGNKSSEEIIALSKAMIEALIAQKVDAIAIACNTISTLVERLRPMTSIPLIDIIRPTARYIAACGQKQIGLFATEFTVKSGLYAKFAKEINPEVQLYAVASRSLAAYIDTAIEDEASIRQEIARMLDELASLANVHTIVLGCTHYPIVLPIFKALAPQITFIDPADLQAEEVLRYLPQPTLDIFTSGQAERYQRMLEHLGLPTPRSISSF